MKIITVNLPKSLLEGMEIISFRTSMRRSELLRIAIRDLLIKELAELEKERERKTKTHIFDYCINCDQKLEYFYVKSFNFHPDYKILGIRYCNICYDRFKNRSFYDLPADLIVKMKKKLKAYKEYRESTDSNKLTIKEKRLIQKLERQLEKINKLLIFDYCINCDRKLENIKRKDRTLGHSYKLFGLNFCLHCYEKFKDTALDELPEYLITRIKRKCKAYKDYIEKSNAIKFSLHEMICITKLEKQLEELRIKNFFDYCINCDAKLHTRTEKSHIFHKKFEIFELKFCCNCYRKFKNKLFEEFPQYLIDRIKRNMKAYKSYFSNKNQK